MIKIKLLEFPESLKQLEGRDVFLVAATLRPETMYGQTNCFLLPDGVYGCFESKDDEVFICSERSALNMSYQGILKTDKKVEKICDVKGSELIGKPIKAPMTSYDKIYIWPMLSISMGKGTGVVTSVPSDSPDDYAVLMDLVNKKPFREKFGLTDEMVLPFEPLSIIDVPDYSDLCAVKAYKEFKIKSSNDKKKLVDAKDKTYKLGFNTGIMKVGDLKGRTVKEAKPLIKKMLIEQGIAVNYFEPENKVVSRSGDECIVAYIDQWFIPYGEEEYKKKVIEHINSEEFDSYNPLIKDAFEKAIDWLKDWGCSRSFGLGTKLPWDETYIVESLSDSTIYMAYYTVAHYFQKDLFGQEPGELGVTADKVSNEDWDFIFLNKSYVPDKQTIEEDRLTELRESFRYWYPLDLRVSGKDLIRNHLTMSLYNHSAVWQGENMMPRGYFANGWILVDNKKMSKSEGNFYTLKQLNEDFGADASRIGLATAGDNLDDANLAMEEVNQGILKLSALEMWLKDNLPKIDSFRTETTTEDNIEFYDTVFDNQLKKLVYESTECYDHLVMRKVVEHVFFGLQKLREDYHINCGTHGMRKDLVVKYCEYQLLLLYPMAPHFTEMKWKDLFLPSLGEGAKGYPELISFAEIPTITYGEIDHSIVHQAEYIKKLSGDMNSNFDGILKKAKKKKNVDVSALKTVNIIIASNYDEWQVKILNYLKEQKLNKENAKGSDWKAFVTEVMVAETAEIDDKKKKKQVTAKAYQFASAMMADCSVRGESAYELKSTFDERALISTNEKTVLRDLKQIDLLNIIEKSDAVNHENIQIVAIAKSCMPGHPQII